MAGAGPPRGDPLEGQEARRALAHRDRAGVRSARPGEPGEPGGLGGVHAGARRGAVLHEQLAAVGEGHALARLMSPPAAGEARGATGDPARRPDGLRSASSAPEMIDQAEAGGVDLVEDAVKPSGRRSRGRHRQVAAGLGVELAQQAHLGGRLAVGSDAAEGSAFSRSIASTRSKRSKSAPELPGPPFMAMLRAAASAAARRSGGSPRCQSRCPRSRPRSRPRARPRPAGGASPPRRSASGRCCRGRRSRRGHGRRRGCPLVLPLLDGLVRARARRGVRLVLSWSLSRACGARRVDR